LLHDLLIAPFAEFGFLRRALVGCLALSVAAPPLGVFLVLRRMSLTADELAHGILPGVAAGFLVAGLSVTAMSLGGLVAGLLVTLGAGALSRATGGREDSTLAALYLVALALGVVMISATAGSVELTNLLFGSVLGVDDPSLLMMAGVATITLLALALAWRPLVLECFDPSFARAEGRAAGSGTCCSWRWLC
jgi:zinc/manganese transport system permease protein